jgi:hypothetical protein
LFQHNTLAFSKFAFSEAKIWIERIKTEELALFSLIKKRRDESIPLLQATLGANGSFNHGNINNNNLYN